MKLVCLIFIIITFGLWGCKTKNRSQPTSLTAKTLFDSATHVLEFGQQGRTPALKLLDIVTQLDSNYYQAYFDKLPLLSDAKDYQKALQTVNQMIRLRPYDPQLYVTRGLLTLRIGDSVYAERNFRNALTLYNKTLDTLPKERFDYSDILFEKAVCLILEGHEDTGRKIIQQLSSTDIDDRLRTSIGIINKQNRKEILESSIW